MVACLKCTVASKPSGLGLQAISQTEFIVVYTDVLLCGGDLCESRSSEASSAVVSK